MSKTLKLNVTFPITAVVNTETVVDLEGARLEAREAIAEMIPMKGEQLAMFKLFASEMTTEALLETILRKGLREIIRKEINSEMNNGETTVRVGDIKVAFEKPMEPRSCNGCIKDTCGRNEKLTGSGCALKMTGLRVPVQGRDWGKVE